MTHFSSRHFLSLIYSLVLFPLVVLGTTAQAQEDPFIDVVRAAGLGQPHPFLDGLSDQERKVFVGSDGSTLLRGGGPQLTYQEKKLLSQVRTKWTEWYLNELPPTQRELAERVLKGDGGLTPEERNVLSPIRRGLVPMLRWREEPELVEEGQRNKDQHWIFGFGEHIVPSHALVFVADNRFYKEKHPDLYGGSRGLSGWENAYRSFVEIADDENEKVPDGYETHVLKIRVGQRQNSLRVFGVPILTWGPTSEVVYSDTQWKEPHDQFQGMWDSKIDVEESGDWRHICVPFVNYFWIPIVLGTLVYRFRLRTRQRRLMAA